jgi:stearoyl-CoA desaturase (delta-9 desaturase)
VTLELWLAPWVGFVISQIAIIATSVYLHRGLAHGSLVIHPIAAAIGRTVLWLTTGQCRREWVAVHRRHHAFTDREGDPHSPQLLGFWRVQLLNAYYYAREARKPRTLRTFAPDLVGDGWDRHLFSRGWLGLGLGIALLCGLLGLWAGLLAALVHAVLYVGVLAPLVNARGHWAGSQAFANTAFNSPVLACITGGESLHNNHHAYPRAPKFSIGRRQFDPSWPVIRALAAVSLVRIVGERAPGGADGRAARAGRSARPAPRPGGERRTRSSGRTVST